MLLGFYLPDNFKSPYISTNIGEFWQRWHITFSQWLRDYIYIPLGGSRRGKWRVSLNLFLTFLFCGLWHGATWGYVLWGALHGIALAVHKRNRDRKRAKGIDPTIKKINHWAVLGWCYTFAFVCLSRVVFYAPDLSTAMVYYSRLFSLNSIGLGAEYTMIVAILIGLSLNFIGPTIFNFLHNQLINMQTVYRKVSTSPVRSTIMGFAFTFITLFLLLGSLIGILLLRPGDVAFYLYFRF